MKRLSCCFLLVIISVAVCSAADKRGLVNTADSCRFSLRRDLTAASSAILINAVATELMKDNIREVRPDGQGDHSFPSRHASYAFTFSAVLSHELCRYSPLWVSALHTVANAVAMQRVYAERHYPRDVLAGAALGLISTELGYCLSDLIFPSDRCKIKLTPAQNSRTIITSSEILIPFSSCRDGLSVGCGIQSTIAAEFPLAVNWGAGASINLCSYPVFDNGSYIGALNGAAICANAYWAYPFGFWLLDATTSLGLLHNFDRPYGVSSAFAPLFDLSATVSRKIARSLTIGPKVGLDITNRPNSLCALSAGIIVKAEL